MSMYRHGVLIVVGVAALGLPLLPTLCASAGEKESPKVLFFTRNVGYEHSVVRRNGEELSHAEKVFTEMCRKVGVEVECMKDGRVFDGNIDQYDAFVFYTNNDLTKPNKRNVPPMSAAGKQKLLDAVAAGKGFVGFHSTSGSWRTPDSRENNSPVKMDPFLAMLGGEFVSHGAQQKATVRVVSRKFPGANRVGGGFALHEEWYFLKNYADDLHVILLQETARMKGDMYQRPPYPITWARKHGKGRVFYTAMGHREDVWTHDVFQKIVLGGLAWSLGKVEVDVSPNVNQFAPDLIWRKR